MSNRKTYNNTLPHIHAPFGDLARAPTGAYTDNVKFAVATANQKKVYMHV